MDNDLVACYWRIIDQKGATNKRQKSAAQVADASLFATLTEISPPVNVTASIFISAAGPI